MSVQTAKGTFPGVKKDWNGFDLYEFKLDGINCKIAAPENEAPGRPWMWRARFFGAWPAADIELLHSGYHVVYIDVINLFGAPEAVGRFNRFYDFLVTGHHFAPKTVLIGYSRGGLIVYNWAAENPDKVTCIYADNPVCDFRSWPGGKGNGPGELKSWELCLEAYGLNEDETKECKCNPIDKLKPLAEANIPLLHIVGDVDEVVPVAENTDILAQRYRELGGKIEIIHKPDARHHPHSLEDPTPIIEFIKKASN